jgi:ribosomal protein L33
MQMLCNAFKKQMWIAYRSKKAKKNHITKLVLGKYTTHKETSKYTSSSFMKWKVLYGEC